MNRCNWTTQQRMRANLAGYVLPHCGSPTCGVCVGRFKPDGPTRLNDPLATYIMPRRAAVALMVALGHMDGFNVGMEQPLYPLTAPVRMRVRKR